jgi:hypothetical protein
MILGLEQAWQVNRLRCANPGGEILDLRDLQVTLWKLAPVFVPPVDGSTWARHHGQSVNQCRIRTPVVAGDLPYPFFAEAGATCLDVGDHRPI